MAIGHSRSCRSGACRFRGCPATGHGGHSGGNNAPASVAVQTGHPRCPGEPVRRQDPQADCKRLGALALRRARAIPGSMASGGSTAAARQRLRRALPAWEADADGWPPRPLGDEPGAAQRAGPPVCDPPLRSKGRRRTMWRWRGRKANFNRERDILRPCAAMANQAHGQPIAAARAPTTLFPGLRAACTGPGGPLHE